MENIWVEPKGYDRTSEKLQSEYMRKLVERRQIGGNLLDVACGTGNLLASVKVDNIVDYWGIDISSDMIEVARERFPQFHDKFIVSDFLAAELPDVAFDHVVLAACMHWFRPNEKEVMQKVWNALSPLGYVHMSGALKFSLRGDDRAKDEVLESVRERFPTIGPKARFSKLRFQEADILSMMDGFKVDRFERFECTLTFTSFEDFRDWHVGSGSVVGLAFEPSVRETALEAYFVDLYSAYATGDYQPLYGTFLLNAKKCFQ